MPLRLNVVSLLLCLVTFIATAAQERKTRDQLVKEDRAALAQDDAWIYNDLPKGVELARASGKPLLVVFRCIPCEACAQLDASIVERDARVRGLMQQYVCVRIVHANGLDLRQFQYDFDQSFAAFIMNADKTIYGRYGTRSDQIRSEDDVSLDGFARILEAGLTLHRNYPANRSLFAGKQTRLAPPVAVPEEFVRLRKFSSQLDYEGKVAQSCIHCHQVGESYRNVLRDEAQPIPEPVLFPYPHPKILGLIMDPHELATVKQVVAGSPAAAAGLQAGDRLETLDGQPMLSIADIQWVLQHAQDGDRLSLSFVRQGATQTASLMLAPGWRRQGDISWRATSWELRRMVTGGMLLEDLPSEARGSHGIADDSLALLVKHLGQYGEHAHAKEKGFMKDDILVAVDGQTKRLRESDLFAELVNRPLQSEVGFTVLRGEQRLELTLTMRK